MKPKNYFLFRFAVLAILLITIAVINCNGDAHAQTKKGGDKTDMTFQCRNTLTQKVINKCQVRIKDKLQWVQSNKKGVVFIGNLQEGEGYWFEGKATGYQVGRFGSIVPNHTRAASRRYVMWLCPLQTSCKKRPSTPF